jgi:hypothetical protein
MKRVTYVSKTPVNLGRFGQVHKGQVLDLYEHEWLGVEGDKRFDYKPAEYSKAELQAASDAMPYGTPVFDLRTIPWDYRNLFTSLEARSGKKRLLKIIAAMRHVGAPVREVSQHEPRTLLVDAIVEAAALCGWLSLTKYDLHALPDSNPSTKPKATPKPKPEPKAAEPASEPEATQPTKPARRRTRRKKPTTKKTKT